MQPTHPRDGLRAASLEADPNRAAWRIKLGNAIAAKPIETTLIALILINAAILGLETYPAAMAAYGPTLMLLDRIILAVFVVEIGLRIAAHGWRFFRDPWGVFDFLVVAIALVPASGPFAVLRALRVLRVLRILTLVPSMRRVVGGLLAAIPGLSSVVAVMGLIFYVGAVIATKLFGASFPDWFGSLGESAYTLFQVMTLESWSMGIARPVIEVYPFAWAFFIPFILIATFTMLNLFIAVIVNAIQSFNEGEHKAEQHETVVHVDQQHEITRAEIVALRAEVRALHELLAGGQGRSVS